MEKEFKEPEKILVYFEEHIEYFEKPLFEQTSDAEVVENQCRGGVDLLYNAN